MPKTYKSKPHEVEAVQWTGDNLEEVKEFYPRVFIGLEDDLTMPHGGAYVSCYIGDYVVKGEDGRFRFTGRKVFENVYGEKVDCADPALFCFNCGCGKKERLGG